LFTSLLSSGLNSSGRIFILLLIITADIDDIVISSFSFYNFFFIALLWIVVRFFAIFLGFFVVGNSFIGGRVFLHVNVLSGFLLMFDWFLFNVTLI
jgi:hypothetical protein